MPSYQPPELSPKLDDLGRGRLVARPATPAGPILGAGVHRLGLGLRRDGLISIPSDAAAAVPVLLMLHGAGGDARGAIALVDAVASARHVIVVAPESRGSTWELVHEEPSADLRFVDAALAVSFARHPVDRERIGIAGFSDGASYALSIGLANGDLFRAVLAFSPGFAAPPIRVGLPRVFVSHGRGDPILPIARCSHRIVAALLRAGYQVTYDEFDGGHVVPIATLTRGFEALLDEPV